MRVVANIDSWVRLVLLAVLFFVMSGMGDNCPDKCQCSRNYVAHCASKGLASFPSQLPNGTLRLLIENNTIRTLTELGIGSTQLHTINLQNNEIGYLPSCVFCSAKQLKHLNLSSNKLEYIPTRSLAKLKDLNWLSMTNNIISTIYTRAFDDLESLKELYLSNNCISNLPSRIFFPLTELKVLRLDHNAILRISNGFFRSLTSLSVLGLSYNRLQQMTYSATSGLNNLQELYLQGNNIREIDSQVSLPEVQCSELNEQVREQTRPRYHCCFSRMTKLQVIDLSDNFLSRIKYSSFSSLPQLSTVGLGGNPWSCDCFLIWSLMRLNSEHGNKHLEQGHMTCWEPRNLRNVSIDGDLTLQDLSQFPHYVTNSKTRDFVKSTRARLWRTTPIPQANTTAPDLSVAASSFATTHQDQEMLRNLARQANQRKNVAPETNPMSRAFPNLASTFRARTFNVKQNPTVPTNQKLAMKQDAQSSLDIKPKLASIMPSEAFNEKKTTTSPNVKIIKSNTKKKGLKIASGAKTDHKGKPPLATDEHAISWLPVAGIFVVGIMVIVCGGLVLNKQFNQTDSKCGCCGCHEDNKKRINQTTSESVRSVSNYPLLYDNPLAKRPLPRQPVHQIQDDNAPTRPIRASNINGDVDIRWTSGGAFGIGDINQSSAQIVRSPVRFQRQKNTRKDFPPIIPPRMPRNAHGWRNDLDRTTFNSNNISHPDRSRSPCMRRQSHVQSCNERPSDRGYPSVMTSYSCRSHENSRFQSDRNIGVRKKSYHNQGKWQNDNSVAIEDNSQNEKFNLAPSKHPRYNNAKGPVRITYPSSNSSETSFSSSRSHNDRIVAQVLEVLHAIENSKQCSIEAEKQRFNNASFRENNKLTVSQANNQISQSSDDYQEKIQTLRSTQPIKINNQSYFDHNNCRHQEWPQFMSPKQSSRHGYRADQGSNCSSHCDIGNQLHNSGRISNGVDVDFEFPPLPPCATVSCSEDSQAYSSSVSEASYNMDFPPPPFLASSSLENISSYETPATNYCAKEGLHSEVRQNYSVLAHCSSGNEASEPNSLKSAYVIREADYKRKQKSSEKSDWRYGRKDSTDSMFVSIDSNRSSRLPSDGEFDTPPSIIVTEPCESVSVSSSNYCPNVNMRHSNRESINARLRQLKEEYRKSMPLYNDLIRRSTHISENERQQLLARSRSLLGSSKWLYESNRSSAQESDDTVIGSNRLSRLELSCSESDSEDISFAAKTEKSQLNKVYFTRSRSPSVGSTATILPVDDQMSENEKPRDKNKLFQVKSSTQERLTSTSSFGSESVSSIEFGESVAVLTKHKNYNYQTLSHMYSGQIPLTKNAVTQLKNVLHRCQRSADKECSNKPLVSSASIQLSSRHRRTCLNGQKRCYLDTQESSADEASTDIEMFDLGTL